MDEPQKIPIFEYTKDDPKQLRLWPSDEDYNENNSQSISELETDKID